MKEYMRSTLQFSIGAGIFILALVLLPKIAWKIIVITLGVLLICGLGGLLVWIIKGMIESEKEIQGLRKEARKFDEDKSSKN